MINLGLLSRVINQPNVKEYLNVESAEELKTAQNHVEALYNNGTIDENTYEFIGEYLSQQNVEKGLSVLEDSGSSYQGDYGDYSDDPPEDYNEEDDMEDFDDAAVVQQKR